MLALGAFAWLGKSAALYYFFKNIRDFDEVTLVDTLVFPFNRASVRIQQGDYQIDQAKAALEREDYRRAYSLLREGVARSPANLEGRMLLAQIYAGWRPDLAADLLVTGIEYGLEDPEYIKLMNMLLLNQKQDHKILEITEELLAQSPPEDVQQILNVARLQSAMFLGRYDIAQDVFENTNMAMTLDGVILGTRLYMRSNQPETATQVLLSVIRSLPDANLDPVYTQLVSIYKEQDMFDRAREAALELVIRNPMEWRPRILLIDVLSASGQNARRDREIEALLQQHRNEEPAMIALAQLCADYGNVRSASRLYEIALENGYSLSLFSLALAEAFVNNGQPQRAIDLCNELVREDPSWLINAESSFNAIRSLAYYNFGDPELGALYLKNFLSSRRSNVNQLYQASRSFRKFGMDQQALQILEEAYRRDTNNEQVLASLVDLEMNLGGYFAVDDHLEALFTLRRPDYTLLESIHQRLQSDRFLFTDDRVALLQELEKILRERDSMDWEIWERSGAGEAGQAGEA
jgi:predicted Zn-dependent protease